MYVLEAKGIKKSFGKLDVLKGVDLSVSRGDAIAIIGPSGSGKSTFLRSLINLEKIDAGTIMVEGQPVVENGIYVKSDEAREAYKKLGMVFQNFNLFPHKSVMENITMAPVSLKKMSQEEAVAEGRRLLAQIGLSDRENAYPYELSGGQQQRVAIARALALKPEILLFDEPTSALDPELTGEVLRVIRKLAEEKMTLIIVTHEMSFARDVADRIIFMDGGVIAHQGTPEEVFSYTENERLAAFFKNFNEH
ncbi:MAG: amino acid ABC transporter ATP-binding protein [Clostridia bacterium]|nr:amino acid ABC transporter ATP-binding protein [Clostridia bacterium]